MFANALLDRLKQLRLGLSEQPRANALESLFGWLLFLAVLAWFYRLPPWMWSTHLHYGGDVIEAVWQANFWRDAVLSGDFNLISREMAYPVGTHQLVEAHSGPGLLLLPISLAFGGTAAVNVGFVGGIILCFIGARRFLRFFTPSELIASLGASAVTFALGRTVHVTGHLHVSLGSTGLVWFAAALMALRQRADEPSAWKRAVAGGFWWGASIIAQPYFLFLCLPLTLLLGRQQKAWRYVPAIVLTAAVISGPYLLSVSQAIGYMEALPPPLQELAHYTSKPWDFVGWGRLSFWKDLAQIKTSWKLPTQEANLQNWGIGTLILSSIGALVVWRKRKMRVLIALVAITLVLSFGPVWRHERQNPPSIQRLNELLWHLGARIKPSTFDASSGPLKSDSVPLPGILPVMFVPRYESARVAARHSIALGLVAAALVVTALGQVRGGFAIVLGCLWLVELLPAPSPTILLPQQPHPAHIWAAQQLTGSDKATFAPRALERPLFLLHSRYLANRLPSANALLSFLPAHILYMLPWYANLDSEGLLDDPASLAMLRRAQVGVILASQKSVELAKQNSALRFVECFAPKPHQKAYYPTLCAFELLPDPEAFFTIQPIKGFSTFEPRWVWIEGTHAQAGWWMNKPDPRRLEIALRAFCPATGEQTATIKLNGRTLATHRWVGNCWELWPAQLTLPAEQLRPGLNRLEIAAASAAPPYLYDANNPDRRPLSVLVERLRVLPVEPAEAGR